MPEIAYRTDRAAAVITFANPPVNGLCHAVRLGLSNALDRAQADPAVRAIVLTGAGGLFSGGADIREFGTPAGTAEPTLRQVIERVETSPKPVVAAIAGACLGGGLELAMAAHYRVASADARLVGAERAIEMITGGEPVPAAALAGARLLDRVVEGDPLSAAIELAVSAEGLRHAFFAERAAGKVEGIGPGTPVRPLDRAAVIGAGTMGAGIAVALLDAGIPVQLLEADEATLDRGLARIAGIYDGQVKKGRLTAAERDRRLALLRPTLSYDDIAGADVVIEAVFESLEVKRAVLQALDRVMKPGAVLATNTSTLDVNAMAGFTRRPSDVLGLHFFSPANVMRLLEVVRGRATAPEVLATALALAKRLRKVAVVAGVCDGFIGNRMLDAYVREAWRLVGEGATPWQVDRAMEAFGMAMGPFRVGDLVGHDVSQAIRQHRRATRPGYVCSTLPDKLCAMGRLGQKTGGGWYDYPEGPRKPVASAVVEEMIAAHREEIGMTPRRIEDGEIVDRLVSALANEGTRLLEEGIAARASDIDVVWITGYGFPRWRGGPMFFAADLKTAARDCGY